MEENKISDQNSEQVGDNQNNEQKDKVAYETYRRTLSEAKKFKAEARGKEETIAELMDRVKSYEQSQAEQEGRKDDVIKTLREEASNFKKRLQNTQKEYATNIVTSQLKSEATKQGCVNPDKLIKLLSSDDLKSIDIDDAFQINSEDLERVIANAKEEHSDIHLFSSKKVNVNDVKSPSLMKAKEKEIAPEKSLKGNLEALFGA